MHSGAARMTTPTTDHSARGNPRRSVRRTVTVLAVMAFVVYLATFAQILLMK